jgi:hypothetical protein
MKAPLMFPDRPFDPAREPPAHEAVLRQDLALDVLWNAMADGDAYLFDIARKAMLGSLEGDVATVSYRQEVLRDSLDHPDTMRALYDLAVQAIEGKRKSHWSFFGNHPSSTLHGAVDVMGLFVAVLKKLREMADAQAGAFHSRGLVALFAMLRAEFGDDYLARV